MSEPSQEERDRNYYAVASARQLTHEARLRAEKEQERGGSQIAFMECREDACKGTGSWFNDSGNREWFVYSPDPRDDPWRCPECNQLGTRYPY